MSMGEVRSIVLKEVAFWNGHDAEAVEQVYAADYVGHDPGGTHAGSLADLKRNSAAVFAAFPDFYLTADDIVVEGDKAVKRWTARATHLHPYMGIPATGKQVTVTGTNVFRIANHRIAECWAQSDTLGLLQQLDVIPPMG